MIRSLQNLIGYRIVTANGGIGTVEDFYFTDDDWRLRYLGVVAGGRHVPVGLTAIDGITDQKREIAVKLTRESAYASPDTESDKAGHAAEGDPAVGTPWLEALLDARSLGVDPPSERMEIDAELPGANPHLRSSREVSSYKTRRRASNTLFWT